MKTIASDDLRQAGMKMVDAGNKAEIVVALKAPALTLLDLIKLRCEDLEKSHREMAEFFSLGPHHAIDNPDYGRF